MSAPATLELPHGVRITVVPGQFVETRLPTGHACVGVRPDTAENREQAEEQGYPPTAAGLWESLRDHEILHSLLAHLIRGDASFVMLHESGARRVPYAERLWEEAIVIAFQRYWNTGERWHALAPYPEDTLHAWGRQFLPYVRQLADAAAAA